MPNQATADFLKQVPTERLREVITAKLPSSTVVELFKYDALTAAPEPELIFNRFTFEEIQAELDSRNE